MEKETYWSRFAKDFEERNLYVVGKKDTALVHREVSKLTELQKVLELGCGNGTYSKILENNATELTATDFSDEMVAASAKRLANYGKITVAKADCCNLPFANASYDTIFMANLLHVIADPAKALKESRRVLKKDGRLVILSFTSEAVGIISKIMMIYRYLKVYGKPSPHSRTLTVNMAEQMLVKNGFTVSESRLIGDKMKAIFIVAAPLATPV